jgi:NhaP-type Na+/H+ or K+/H+ antiporter
VVFVLNVLAFVLIGLQLGPILGSLSGAVRAHFLLIAGLVFATVVVVRMAWVFTYNRVAYIKHRLMGPGRWPGEVLPTLSGSLVVGWSGMRGIVTLAAAYALPEAFPYRELALLCAFCVVVGTLVVQGLTLRPLILAVGLTGDDSVSNEVKVAKAAIAAVAAQIIDGADSPAAQALRAEFILESNEDGSPTERERRNELRARIVAAQRDELVRLRDTGVIGDNAFHQIEERLDRIEIVVG